MPRILLVVGCVLLPGVHGLVAADSAPSLVSETTFLATGTGHFRIEVAAKAEYLSGFATGIEGEELIVMVFSGPTVVDNILRPGEDPGGQVLHAGTYDVYLMAPEARSVSVRMVWGAEAGEATYDMESWHGQLRQLPEILHGSNQGMPVYMNADHVNLHGDSVLLTLQYVHFSGIGAGGQILEVKVSDGLLENKCRVGFEVTAVTGGFSRRGFQGFSFIHGPGPVYVENVNAVAGVSHRHDAYVAAVDLAPGDPLRAAPDWLWSLVWDQPGVSALPPEAHTLVQGAACAVTPPG